MSDESQLVVPPSLVALFVEPGRAKPNTSGQHILERHEFCENLAMMLMDLAKQLWELSVAEADVLERVHRGLLNEGAGVEIVEAAWVIHRLAELLDWACPALDAGAVARR